MAILAAASLFGLMIAVAMVLDFGLVRADRQMNKSSADAATAAGMRGLDQGDGKAHSYAGICQALTYLKLSQPELANLPDASNAAGGNVTCPPTAAQAAAACIPGTTNLKYAATSGRVTVTISTPYLVSTGNFPEESSATLVNDVGDPAQQGCDQVGVIVEETKRPGLGSLATASDLVTRVRSVGRVTLKDDGQGAVALLLLERTNCSVIVVNGVNSFVRVLANGDVPGLIHSDSDGTGCSGGQRILVGDHANGILAQQSPASPGIIRLKAIGTANAGYAYDSLTNVVAQGSTPAGASLVGRGPIDDKYIVGARAALSDFAAQSSSGYTVTLPCGATNALLEAVPDGSSLWIECNTNQSFTANNLTLNASKIYVNAKSLEANNLSMPNATRVYVRGDTTPNGAGVNVTGGTLRMHHGGVTPCPSTLTTPTTSRARLVIGAGSLKSNSTGVVQLCGTSVIMGGGVTSPTAGCIPGSSGAAPFTSSCQGRINLGGPTDWTAPSTTPLQASDADRLDLEDLALWTEADGTHDIGGGGAMRLSGVFMVPNGNFQVHGGSTQDVRNSQYIARNFRADGGSVLEMQPNPYDVITIPIIGGYFLVR